MAGELAIRRLRSEIGLRWQWEGKRGDGGDSDMGCLFGVEGDGRGEYTDNGLEKEGREE